MESTIARVQVIFDNLLLTELVTDRVADGPRIEKFSAILNMMTTVQDYTVGKVVRLMYKADRAAFIKYVKDSKSGYLALLIGGQAVAEVLGLSDIITIAWYARKARYIVAARAKRQHPPAPLHTAALSEAEFTVLEKITPSELPSWADESI